MKISIKNFKPIGLLDGFQLKPLTILAGVNSSGKSSFLQLLLILKQTIELDSGKHPFLAQGKYYSARTTSDLIKGKDIAKAIEIKFLIEKSEFDNLGDAVVKSIFDRFPEYTCLLRLTFCFHKNDIYIQEFEVSYFTAIKEEILKISQDLDTGAVIILTNNDYFLKLDLEEDLNDVAEKKFTVNYSAFFPKSIEEVVRVLLPNIVDEEGKPSFDDKKRVVSPDVRSIQSFLERYFQELYYIGPLRLEPQDSYSKSTEFNWVGVKGENTAQILETRKDESIEVFVPVFEENSIRYELKTKTLIEATNIWMCDVFNFCKKLYAKETGENYSIILQNHFGIDTNIKHVGFGISQVLPIVVQGLLLKKGGTLMLEQPEIHLHPKIQSFLFDFIHSLIIQDKYVIIETHSDHFITRMRRRVAEDETSLLGDKIQLTFILQEGDQLNFKPIHLDKLGIYDIFPEDFIENPEKELQALISAQMKKRKSKRTEK